MTFSKSGGKPQLLTPTALLGETGRDGGPNLVDKLYGDRTCAQWDLDWTPIEGSFTRLHPELSNKVGLFRAVLNGEVKVIGSATAKRGGFTKRLAQFLQPNDFGRRHRSGAYIHANLADLNLEVLVTGPNNDAARKQALQLKEPMIALHKPSENAPRRLRLEARFR